LIELEPQKLTQTLRSGRKGNELVAKRLEIFLISKGMIDYQWKFKSLVVLGGISDHIPIVLEIDKKNPHSPSPTKFNHDRLLEEDFKRIILSSWSPLVGIDD
jgi:hypothetical protein